MYSASGIIISGGSNQKVRIEVSPAIIIIYSYGVLKICGVNRASILYRIANLYRLSFGLGRKKGVFCLMSNVCIRPYECGRDSLYISLGWPIEESFNIILDDNYSLDYVIRIWNMGSENKEVSTEN